MSRSRGWPMVLPEGATHIGTARIRTDHKVIAPSIYSQHDAIREAPKKSKYGCKKVNVDGIEFDSQREANRWLVLREMQEAGAIGDLERQVVFVLAPPVRLNGRQKPALRYVADFTYMQEGEFVVEDVKSKANADGKSVTANLATYRIKKHLMMSVHGIEIHEVK